ncbi:hypothetical protein BB560_006662 [Smittium megazygosporum]|uniref:CN hydrolase domain-containing protein n=1 Tax=Smittium megazygosporum TaxID=133381 RepID=A0A2T9Y2L1_9FUNG|nr:hypothetical protein BB560_006662 [Smittium megazygosporum]
MTRFKIALAQINVQLDKNANLEKANEMALEASKNGAGLVVFPECFNTPYDTKYFRDYAEVIDTSNPSGTTLMLSNIAKECGVFIVGGSIPEKDPWSGKYFNTSVVFDNHGIIIAVHRKMHLADLNAPGRVVLSESDVFSPGSDITVFATPWGNIGLGICYDIRFTEISLISARRDNVIMMIFPAAFTAPNGQMFWEIYVAGCGPAQDETVPFHSNAHSTVVGPDGLVVVDGGVEEKVVYCDIGMVPLNLH